MVNSSSAPAAEPAEPVTASIESCTVGIGGAEPSSMGDSSIEQSTETECSVGSGSCIVGSCIVEQSGAPDATAEELAVEDLYREARCCGHL